MMFSLFFVVFAVLTRPCAAQVCDLQMSGLSNSTFNTIYKYTSTSEPDNHTTYDTTDDSLMSLQFDMSAKQWQITSLHSSSTDPYTVYAKCVDGCDEGFPRNPKQEPVTGTHWQVSDGHDGWRTEVATVGCCKGQRF